MEKSIFRGSVWRHYRGDVYQVLVVANEDAAKDNYPTTVVYRDFDGKIWAKTKEDFLKSMKEMPND